MNCQPNRFNLLTVCLLVSAASYAQPEPAAMPPLPPTPPEQVLIASVQHTPVSPAWQETTIQDRIELRRRLIKAYTVSPSDLLAIDNRFGDVTVTHWDRNEMRVEVTITASSDSHDRAEQALNAVRVDERRNDNAYMFQTVINKEYEAAQGDEKSAEGTKKVTKVSSQNSASNEVKTNWSISWSEKGRSIRVDYRISMPKANGLTIKNRFGNVTVPDFSAPINLDSKFGNVYGAAMSNAATVIKSSFGNVTIRDVQHGRVDMSFGDLDINSGNVLTIVQNYGKLRIGATNQVNAQMSYADAVIGAIRQSGRLNVNYAKQLRLEQLPASANQLDVVANFSTVALPVQPQTNCDFDVTVTNGGFTYPTLPNLRLTTPQMPTAPSPPGSRRKQQFVGRVGTGDGPRIRVVSTFGDVKFK